MRLAASFVFVLFLCGLGVAQQARKNDSPTSLRPGVVYGEIMIKEVSGNHLGNFSCSNITVNVSRLGDGWKRTATATGSFAGRRCSYRVTNIPAGETFVATLTADFPNGCDQKNFDTTTSFPMELKSREQLRYGFAVSRIRCVLVK
jgi:hypothetical protein